MQVWEEIGAGEVGEEVPTDAALKRLFLEPTNYYGQEAEMDAQGRFFCRPAARSAA